jgi:hypothetical protein
LILGSQAVWGEQTVGGGVCAKKRIEEILESVKNNASKQVSQQSVKKSEGEIKKIQDKG